jgi:hypothetical protein
MNEKCTGFHAFPTFRCHPRAQLAEMKENKLNTVEIVGNIKVLRYNHMRTSERKYLLMFSVYDIDVLSSFFYFFVYQVLLLVDMANLCSASIFYISHGFLLYPYFQTP